MSFDQIDRQFRKRETILGLPVLTTAPIRPFYQWQLFEERVFEIIGFGKLYAQAVGSRCTCNPPPTDTDQDWIAYFTMHNCGYNRLEDGLIADGWELCSAANTPIDTEKYPDVLQAWRRGEDNLILFSDTHYYNCFKAASVLAKRFNLLNKKDRIDLFHAVRFGKLPDGQ